MNDQPVMFDREGAARIVKATRWAELESASFADDSPSHAPRRRTEFWFEIAASPTQDGSNYRWTYTAAAKVKASAGWDGWDDDPRFAASKTLLNIVERSNGSTGFVSGYELDDGSNGTMITGIEPIPAGQIVRAWPIAFMDSGAVVVEWWFSERNIPIVECPESEEEE